MNVTPKQFRRASYLTLRLSVLGLILICFLIVGPFFTFEFAASYAVQIALGYAAMMFVIEAMGISLRVELCGYGAGVVFAVFLFIVGVLCGSASSMLVYRDFDFEAYVMRPLFWMGFYGALPAAAFGLIGTNILRRISNATPLDAAHLKP